MRGVDGMPTIFIIENDMVAQRQLANRTEGVIGHLDHSYRRIKISFLWMPRVSASKMVTPEFREKNGALNRRPPFAPHQHVVPHDRFLAHAKLGHDPPRGLILGAAFRLDPVQAQWAKGQLQHGVAHFGRQPLTHAICSNTPSQRSLPPRGEYDKVNRADEFVRNLVDRSEVKLGARVVGLRQNEVPDQVLHLLDGGRPIRRAPPMVLRLNIQAESIKVGGSKLA